MAAVVAILIPVAREGTVYQWPSWHIIVPLAFWGYHLRPSSSLHSSAANNATETL
jgi:hypothetical protein